MELSTSKGQQKVILPAAVLWINFSVWTQAKAIRCMELQTRYNLRACADWRVSNSNARQKLQGVGLHCLASAVNSRRQRSIKR